MLSQLQKSSGKEVSLPACNPKGWQQALKLPRVLPDSDLPQPFKGQQQLASKALARAGLSSWVGLPQEGKSRHERPWEPPKPKLVLEASLADVLIALPFGQDVGACQRFTEHWAKALEKVHCLLLLTACHGHADLY